MNFKKHFHNLDKEVTMKKTILASVLALLATSAHAQLYGEVGYTWLTAKQNVNGNEFKGKPNAIRAIVGFDLQRNLAVEGMVALGVRDGDLKVNGQTISGVKLKVDNAVGVYLKPKARLNDSFEVFGRVGVARVEGTGSAPGFGSIRDSESSLSWGAGLSYAVTQAVGLNVDYMQYANKDGFKANGFTVGVGMRF
ncbi:MAG: porin family protein [bacterium]|jgi:opacity protein-like surface antigen|nr:porin family protein [Betaproteobacteria bacterium]